MATILPANFAFKDADGDVGTVKSLTNADITLLNTALQDIEDLKLCIDDPAPVGFIGLWGDTTVPSGWLLCNGAAVSRITYAGLFAKVGTRYGAGDGSTTFNVPDMRDRYPIGVGTNALATKIAEQLPNITGKFEAHRFMNFPDLSVASFSGALFQDVSSINRNYPQGTNYNGTATSLGFNANLSNSIYADSGKVYPLSLALNFIIKA